MAASGYSYPCTLEETSEPRLAGAAGDDQQGLVV